jgi:hypothetical protein
MRHVNLQAISPQPGHLSFFNWWEKANEITAEKAKKGLNSHHHSESLGAMKAQE